MELPIQKIERLEKELAAANKEAENFKTAWEYQGDRVIKLEAELEKANNKFENYKTAALLFEEKLKAKDEIIKTLKDLWLATEKAISSGIFG